MTATGFCCCWPCEKCRPHLPLINPRRGSYVSIRGMVTQARRPIFHMGASILLALVLVYRTQTSVYSARPIDFLIYPQFPLFHLVICHRVVWLFLQLPVVLLPIRRFVFVCLRVYMCCVLCELFFLPWVCGWFWVASGHSMVVLGRFWVLWVRFKSLWGHMLVALERS